MVAFLPHMYFLDCISHAALSVCVAVGCMYAVRLQGLISQLKYSTYIVKYLPNFWEFCSAKPLQILLYRRQIHYAPAILYLTPFTSNINAVFPPPLSGTV